MTLDQLKVFLAVAASQHVTRAAGELNMTQSAVSAAISALEARYGVALFDRVGRGIVLTEAGRGFVPHAQAILRRTREAEEFLADLEGGVAGPLRIQASQTVASYFLPPVLMAFHARYPRVQLALEQGNTTSVAQAVLSGETDLGVVEGQVSLPDLDIEPIGGDRLMLLVGRAHPWADGRDLSIDDLASADWVLREQGSGTRAAFDRALTAQGMALDTLSLLVELPSNEACIAAIETGRAATVLSELAAAPHRAQHLVVEANFAFPSRAFSILTHRQRHQSQAIRNFRDLLRAPIPQTR